MSLPRGLSPDEAAAWARLASSVTPLHPPREGDHATPGEGAPPAAVPPNKPIARPRPVPLHHPRKEAGSGPSPRSGGDSGGLDAAWERKLARGALQPDFTLDLHGATLDSAYDRLMHGMVQAHAMGARVVLLITGKPRAVDPADRASSRGAIRAKILDWLAASSHGQRIAEVRQAHRRHGSEGALYLVLRRQR